MNLSRRRGSSVSFLPPLVVSVVVIGLVSFVSFGFVEGLLGMDGRADDIGELKKMANYVEQKCEDAYTENPSDNAISTKVSLTTVKEVEWDAGSDTFTASMEGDSWQSRKITSCRIEFTDDDSSEGNLGPGDWRIVISLEEESEPPLLKVEGKDL